LKQEIASNGTIRGGESATPFGLTWVVGWVQGCKILQAGGGGRQQRTGYGSPESRVGCKPSLEAKSRWRWTRWFPFLSWPRGRFSVVACDVPRHLAASVTASMWRRRRLALRFALPLSLVFACNKKTQVMFRGRSSSAGGSPTDNRIIRVCENSWQGKNRQLSNPLSRSSSK
jgi:hypothetical protein